MLPTLSSVRNAVPVPTTFASNAVAVTVPERGVFGQAVASQVPEPALVMFRLVAPAGTADKAANSIIRTVSIAAVLYIRDFVLFLTFIVLLGFPWLYARRGGLPHQQ
jgi:hypothetical protein